METFEAVVAELSDRITAGEFADGRLPTERELAEHYQVSRGVIRKALALIESEGWITRSVGRGTFVTPALPAAFPADALLDISPADMNVARLLFEPAVAEHAAVQATRADLEKIEHCLTQCEEADVRSFDFWDASLHMAIAEATHSNFVVLTFRALNQVRQSTSWTHVKRFALQPERLKVTYAAHRRIAEAIASRDGVEAREAMRDHIEKVGRYIANRD
jgi:DNA-binding FadR family transcriptional regulator